MILAATRSTSARASRRSRTLAIVVADTANPTGGFTDAEYAVVRDDLRHARSRPLDIAELRPADGHRQERQDAHLLHEGSEQAHAARQPTASSAASSSSAICSRRMTASICKAAPRAIRPRCTTRSFPTPTGSSATCAKKTDVQNLTPGTLAHEFQHLINAGPPALRQQRRRLRGSSGSTKA